MTFTTLVPPPPLRQSIDLIWDWRVEPGIFRLERILPQPGSGLIINLLEDETRVYGDDADRRCERSAGVVFSGQFTRSFLIDTSEQIAVMGVIFRPAGACSFLRERMDLLGNQHIALEDLIGRGTHNLRERLLDTHDAHARLAVLEHWLHTRCVTRTPHAAVAFALHELAHSPQRARIGELARESGLSARRFGTLFNEQVGVGAKEFARMQRFRAVIAQVQQQREIEWTQVALDCGFHDQPHLTREFRAFAGMTPTAYVAQRGHDVNHIALD